jgi:hypothetical protein
VSSLLSFSFLFSAIKLLDVVTALVVGYASLLELVSLLRRWSCQPIMDERPVGKKGEWGGDGDVWSEKEWRCVEGEGDGDVWS